MLLKSVFSKSSAQVSLLVEQGHAFFIELGRMGVAGVLLLAVTATAIGVVYSVHISRGVFSELQHLVHQENELEVEWGQLLLEQSALSTPNRIERLAREELTMKSLPIGDAVLVTP